MMTPERKAILFLLGIVEQQLQMNNMVVHATHKPMFDAIRQEFGAPPKAPPQAPQFQFVPEGPGCAQCGKTPMELVESGHGPHAT